MPNLQEDTPQKKDVGVDNSSAIFDLIQGLQSKLNTETTNNSSDHSQVVPKSLDQNGIEQNDINTVANNNSQSTNSLNSILQNLDIGSILASFTGSKENDFQDTTNGSEGNIFDNLDPSMLLKIQRIMGSMNKSDPKKNLLLSLKPFLRKSRQDKMGEYITMLTVANALGLFDNKGSDKNV